MTVKITILYDNRSDDPHLQEGWGFSTLVEHQDAKILFDTGGDANAFSSNVHKVQLSFDKITHLLFSHRHWDHIAGFKNVIEQVSKDAKLYVPKTFPWFLSMHASSRLKKVKTMRSFGAIAPNVYSLVLRGGFFLYEQVLVLKTSKGLGIITGCAHPGIVQILKAARQHLQEDISFVLGGFHMFSAPPDQGIDLVKQFQGLNVKNVAPCHCSGDHLIRQFQEAYGSNFSKVGTGTVLTF